MNFAPMKPANYMIQSNPIGRAMEGYNQGQQQQARVVAGRREAEQNDRNTILQGREDSAYTQQMQDDEAQRYRDNINFEQKQELHQQGMDEVGRQQGLMREFEDDLSFLTKNPTAENYANMIGKHPKYLKPIQEAFDKLDDGHQQTRLQDLGSLYTALESGNIEVADKMFEGRIGALEAEKGKDNTQEIDALKGAQKLLKTDPESVKTAVGINLAKVGEGNDYVKMILGGNQRKTSRSVVFDDGTVLQVMDTGAPIVTDPQGNKIPVGEQREAVLKKARASGASDAGNKANAVRSGTLEADIKLGGTAEQSKAAGKQAVELSGDYFEGAGLVSKGIRAIDRAIAAIGRGANAGLLYRMLPTVNESSAELESSLNELGLNVIAGTSFGALSAGELSLALNTAAPQDLGPEELKVWLIRKKAAQEKLMGEMNKAAKFLSTSGKTLNDWMNQLEQKPEVDDWVLEYSN